MNYKTVRERALEELKKQLKLIQSSNGYNNNIASVELADTLEFFPNESWSIKIEVGESFTVPRCNAREYEIIDINLWIYVQQLEKQVATFSSIIHDIRLLFRCPFTDSSHPNPAMTGIWMSEVSSEHHVQENSVGVIFGTMSYQMEIHYSFNDPCLWDDEYDVKVPQEVV